MSASRVHGGGRRPGGLPEGEEHWAVTRLPLIPGSTRGSGRASRLAAPSGLGSDHGRGRSCTITIELLCGSL